MRVIFDSKDKVSVYHDHRYATWAQRGISGREHQLLAVLLDELPRSERILDIPSGYGRFTPLLLPRTDTLISFDLSHHMLVKAAEQREAVAAELAGRGLAEVSGVNLLAGAVSTGLPLRDKSVDQAVVVRLYQHLHRPEQRRRTLAELNRVTRKRVILTFYRSGTIHHAQRLVKKVKPMMKQITFRSLDQFREEAAAAGLEVERIIKLKRLVHSQTVAVLLPS